MCNLIYITNTFKLLYLWKRIQGRPSPWGHDAFPPISDSPYVRQIFRLCGKFSKFNLFPPKISDDLLCHRPQISNFPLFSLFPPVSRKLLFPPLWKIPLCFRKIRLVLTYFMCISFPPTLTMMHLCITQCTYWTPLGESTNNYVSEVKMWRTGHKAWMKAY